MSHLRDHIFTFPDAGGRPVHIWHIYRTDWASASPLARRLTVLLVVCCIALAAAMPWMLTGKTRPVRTAMVIFATSTSVSALSGLVGGLAGVRLHHAKFVRRSMRKGRCPACGYSLVDLPPLLDGPAAPALVCPECNGTWRLEL